MKVGDYGIGFSRYKVSQRFKGFLPDTNLMLMKWSYHKMPCLFGKGG